MCYCIKKFVFTFFISIIIIFIVTVDILIFIVATFHTMVGAAPYSYNKIKSILITKMFKTLRPVDKDLLKISNKDTTTTSINVVLISLLLNLYKYFPVGLDFY